MNDEQIKIFVVKGCNCDCGRLCAGGWPETNISDEAMTQAVKSRKIDPDKLPCGTLTDNARRGLTEWDSLQTG
jgi:hypothetical protein